MNNDKKINIILILVAIITTAVLIYTLNDFFAFNNPNTMGVANMAIGSFDESIINNGMAEKANIGKLGSQHIHADIKVYVNGKALNFASPKYYMKSSLLHLDDNQNLMDASGVLHMHATSVPLWVFFKSIGMDFSKDCITLENNEKLCNGENKKIKFYVNGMVNNYFENYVFADNDKILFSYGNESGEALISQIDSITDYAKKH